MGFNSLNNNILGFKKWNLSETNKDINYLCFLFLEKKKQKQKLVR